MKFHFEFDIKKIPWTIAHTHNTFLMGSCFTENMGEKFRKHKFRVLENPNGILFNPVSVANAITSYIENRKIDTAQQFYLNEGWHSWNHHSRFSAPGKEEALEKINQSTHDANGFLKTADFIVITLGSAWTYQLTELAENGVPGAVAANNHKAPASWFNRKLMAVEEVLRVLDNMIHRLFHFNPSLHIIFTISPVRHLREGVVENNRSKAVLIQAVHHLVDKFEGLYYFPAYELVIDDLRDYRFYAEDLVHPNYFATEYVWEKFCFACMNESTRKIMDEIKHINLAFRHKPFNPDSDQHKKFLTSSLEKTRNLKDQYPFLDLDREIQYFQTGNSSV